MKMRNLKRAVLAMITLAILLLAACGGKPSTAPPQATDSSPSSPAQASTDTANEDPDTQDPYTVKIAMIGGGNTQDCNEVAAAVSEITKEKFNTNIELVRFGYGDYEDQVSLMLAAGEKLDLLRNVSDVVTMATNGQALPLNDYLQTYGKEMWEMIPEVEWAASTYNGKIYGVRNTKELPAGTGYTFVTEILEETGIDPATLKTDDDVEALLRKVKELHPEMYPLVSGRGGMEVGSHRDVLGGYDFGVLEDCITGSTEVVNWYSCDTYVKAITRRHQWLREGLIMPDPSTNTSSAEELMSAGKAFACITNTKPGRETEAEKLIGKPVTIIETVEAILTTIGCYNQFCVAPNCQDPGRAVQILNEMQINPEVSNLFINGIEGKHYVLIDKEKGIIDYPQGLDPTQTGYPSTAWAWPNELISYVWVMDDPNVWKDTVDFNKNAEVSVAMGFLWDNSKVLPEIAACKNVTAKYGNALDCGELDPAEAIPKLTAELEAAGLLKILGEKQAQLDAWLAGK